MHSCWIIVFFVCCSCFYFIVCAFKMLFGKGFGKENIKEIEKKEKGGSPPCRPGGQPAPGFLPPTRGPAYGPGRAGAPHFPPSPSFLRLTTRAHASAPISFFPAWTSRFRPGDSPAPNRIRGSGISLPIWLNCALLSPCAPRRVLICILIAKPSPSRPKPRELDLADSRAHPSP